MSSWLVQPTVDPIHPLTNSTNRPSLPPKPPGHRSRCSHFNCRMQHRIALILFEPSSWREATDTHNITRQLVPAGPPANAMCKYVWCVLPQTNIVIRVASPHLASSSKWHSDLARILIGGLAVRMAQYTTNGRARHHPAMRQLITMPVSILKY